MTHRRNNLIVKSLTKIVSLRAAKTITRIDKSSIKAWQPRQEVREVREAQVVSNATNKTEVVTEDPVIFNLRDKESKFTAEAQQTTSSQTLLLTALFRTTNSQTTLVVEEVVAIARRNLVTTKLDVVVAAAEVIDPLRSMTRRRSKAGPKEKTSLKMKAKSPPVAEAVVEANVILKGTTMTRTKLLVKMATKVPREAAAATNANTTRVAITRTKMAPQQLEELLERMAKDGVVAADVAAEEAEEPDLREMELVIKTKMVSKITKAVAVVAVAVAIVVVEKLEKLVKASSVAITTAEVAVAKIAATIRRMVANTRKSLSVEVVAVVAELTTRSQT